MFDVSFTELMVIAVVALVVIGPERLPRVARTFGALLGRLQRYVNEVKADVNRELHLEEIRRLHQDMNEGATKVESSVRQGLGEIRSELNTAIDADSPKTLTPPDPAERKDGT